MSLREPLLAEAAGLAGFDYVGVDMQHGLADYTNVVAMVSTRWLARRRFRSSACRGTSPASSDVCSTPVPSASSSRWSTQRTRRGEP